MMCIGETQLGSVIEDTHSRHFSTSLTPFNSCIAVQEIFTAKEAVHDSYSLHADCLGGRSPFANTPLLIA